MKSSNGIFQVKIVKGSAKTTVGNIEEFGSEEPSLKEVVLRFKALYNVT